MAIALHHSAASGTAKLVLLGIANHDGDGGAWPSIDTLAIYAGVHRRNVQRALEQLQQLHEIRIERQAGGSTGLADHRRPNLYSFLLRCPADCDGTKHHRTRRSAPAPFALELSTGVALAPPHLSTGVAPAPPGGVALAPPETEHKKGAQTVLGLPTDRASTNLCTDGTPGHAVSRTAGTCVYCGWRPGR